ncbi:glycosyl hydrolase [Deinococcus malanensis]|uniref:Glycosyl hydrolase n=1 Tax=Deinococcus malanensis TaxID=1706855 RepID=A0ABQ2F1C4_9DEIO|nr:glycoside hydrolase family 3 C-terminal domain-containing protein [Deinococcus malanensis]GGK39629.1 glycosyl hydrolase [Deinococcus malanensis]
MTMQSLAATALAATLVILGTAGTGADAWPWMNPTLSPDQRADLVLRQMTPDEKQRLVFGSFATDLPAKFYRAPREARYGSAGYVPGIPRLGLPPQWQTDAGIGVATQGSAPKKLERTALPSGIATTASWNPEIARRGGAMIGREARLSGFNVMLAGGVNLARDPRNGRTFEYGGEDPLLAGTMIGHHVAGIQSNHIISTVKHFALNNQESGRHLLDARIDEAGARMSDLLAFQFAIERSDAGSVMCAYNRVNGTYACENHWLLTQVLRDDWGFRGYVLSDWGAVHSTEQSAKAGLDQDSGFPFDAQPYFGAPLRQAVAQGRVTGHRLNEMAHRILRAMFDNGVVDHPVTPQETEIDFAAHAEVTRTAAEQGAVLLRNEGRLLPLSADLRRIAVIGGHADVGVLSGGGSSQTYPRGGNAVPGLEPRTWPGPIVYYPSSPVRAIQAQVPGAQVSFHDGTDAAEAAHAAREADVAIVFGTQWASESIDVPLTLPGHQDALIAAVAAANPRTVVVLETGGPVLMPWVTQVPAILEAWYPGTEGGQAIANLLFGRVNPSGRLPITFPRDESQLPRPRLDGNGLRPGTPFSVDYFEGARVGYRWFDANNLEPLFPFGYGLTYTQFEYDRLRAGVDGQDLVVSFRVENKGPRRGRDVPQVYVSPAGGGWEAPRRLAGFASVELEPGGDQMVTLSVDPRTLATWDTAAREWRIARGAYRVMVGTHSRDVKETETVHLPERRLPAGWRPGS